MVNESKILHDNNTANKNLPMIILNEDNLYNVEGFAQLDDKNIHFYDNNQLHYDSIEDDEIVETNREYNYYIKNFFDRVSFEYCYNILNIYYSEPYGRTEGTV